MDCSPVIEYRIKMPDWGSLLSQNSQQYQACYAPQGGSGLDITANSEQSNQANQCRYPRPERRYSVFWNCGTVMQEYSSKKIKRRGRSMKKKKYQYSVALSFSEKQRAYVERVSNELTRLNVRHFYDFNEQENLWGKELTRYLDKIYYEETEYFVPFISKEYVETVWPNLELSAALDRNMNDFRPDYQKYILPVYFDDIRVSGISKSIGYYNANQVTPETLARAIYRKLHPADKESHSIATSDKSINLLGNFTGEFQGMQTKQIETVNSLHLSRIFATCNNDSLAHIIVVYGERGLGKRSSIFSALSAIKGKSIYHVQPFYENRYKYDSIIQSLSLDTSTLLSQNDLDFESDIKRRIISIFTENPSIVYVEHFHQFDEESRKLLYELSVSLITRYTKKDICLIIEFDSDTADRLVEPFYELPPSQTDVLHFNPLLPKEIKECFYNYCGNIKISEENLTYILRSSLGNIMYLNVIINYLQGAGYMCEIDGQLTCKCLPNGALSDVLRKYLLQRYERLDKVLKELLSKSSIIGSIFSVDLLEKPFQIINAAEKLTSIEKISNLIECYTNQTYIFETDDVYNLIRSNISKEQQQEWHSILAHYFQRVLNREKKRKNSLTPEKTISFVYPIAKHFNYAANYQAALPYYFQLISLYTELCDYTNELNIIKDIQFILNLIEMDEAEIDRLESEVLLAKADCYRGLGQYVEAYELYDEVLSFIDDTMYSQTLIDINYNKSYCLYMNGKVIEAQQTLLTLCKRFNLQEEYKKDYIRIISLLASICDATNDYSTQKQLYIEALMYYRENHCDTEYYELLKMASMVFDEVIAIEMEKEAERYFRSNHSIRKLAETLHNLATTELYLMKTEEILIHLDECILLFDSFGSKAVHYPLNTKGIVQMVVEQNYNEAISTFYSSLSASTEAYSEIAIRTNLIQCFIQLKKFDEAYKQIQLVDALIEAEPHGIVPVYNTFYLLNWAVFYFHRNEYKKCEEYLKKLSKQHDIEARHRYIVKSLQYVLRKKQAIKTRNTAGTEPYPIYLNCAEKGLFFATLRFFE